MIEQQQKLVLSPYMEIYELVVPKDNLLRQIKELVDFEFIYDELLDKYCLDNGRNAVPPIRMFKYLLLKAIYDLSDVDVVERSKYDMSFKYFVFYQNNVSRSFAARHILSPHSICTKSIEKESSRLPV